MSQQLLDMAKDPQLVANGKMNYEMLCMSCHGKPSDAELMGDSPSNLFDDIWYHHADAGAHGVLLAIEEGVLEQGMMPWKGMLPDEQLKEITAYILSE